MAGQQLHSELRLQQLGNFILIQPTKDGAVAGPSLSIELQSCAVGLTEHSTNLEKMPSTQKIYGVIGVVRLLGGAALAVITGVDQVAEVRGSAVYRVKSTHIITNEQSQKDDERYAKLLSYAVDPSGAGRGLFFSYSTDLTLTQQRYTTLQADAGATKKPLWSRADPRFFFNRQLTSLLTECHMPGVEKFVLPLVMGSVQQLRSVQFGPSCSGRITLIARRSVQRPGVRHWRRGADAQGLVANFVETEQLVELQTAQGALVSSFVQVRGSIPLLWSQVPNIKYKPTTRLAPSAAYQPAFDRHIKDLVAAYKGVVAINLANQHGSEGVLSTAFTNEAARYGTSDKGLRLVPFDFHKECGATRYDRLALLWAQIRDDFERFGFFLEAAGQSQRQQGVFRVNCIDCLDRTNVVQGVLARYHLDYVLQRLHLLGDSQTLPNAFPKVEAQFKVMWANHGDDISLQYAGTGALKSGFTRTGQRTTGGLLDDGFKSGMRYFLNNFRDGQKQDAFDLVSGAFTISKDKPSPFSPQPSPRLPLLVAFMSALWALNSFSRLITGKSEAGVVRTLLQQVALPVLLAGVLVAYVVKNGHKMVNRPQLRPDLSQPW